MRSGLVIFFEKKLIENVEFSYTFGVARSSQSEAKEFFFVCTKRSFDNRVFVGVRFVDIVMFEYLLFCNKLMKSVLEFETIVSLDKVSIDRNTFQTELLKEKLILDNNR